jgi:hypothetical protein
VRLMDALTAMFYAEFLLRMVLVFLAGKEDV